MYVALPLSCVPVSLQINVLIVKGDLPNILQFHSYIMLSKAVNRVLTMQVKNVYRSPVVFRIIKPCSLVGGCVVSLTQNSGCHVFFKETVQKEEQNVPRGYA